MENEEFKPTDRELISGLYDLIGAICKRKWGETPHVHLDIDGEEHHFPTNTPPWRITWDRDENHIDGFVAQERNVYWRVSGKKEKRSLWTHMTKALGSIWSRHGRK